MLRVHLGLYGAWDFAGDIVEDATTASAERPDGPDQSAGYRRRRGGGGLAARASGLPASPGFGWRRRRSRGKSSTTFPPAPVGAVRVRLLADDAVADLRGPTACEVLSVDEVRLALNKLGPDPLVDSPKKGEERFIAAVRTKSTPIGLLLMDQSVVSGIGNVYRAELLLPGAAQPVHARPRGAGGDGARIVEGLDPAAEIRREDRPDDDDGRSDPAPTRRGAREPG